MKRSEKYPETQFFHYYNANPRNKLTTDCVIRALCTVLEQDYNKTVMDLAELQCKTGYDDGDKKLYDKYLKIKGFVKQAHPKKLDNSKYTGKEWCAKTQLNIKHGLLNNGLKRIIANIGGHHIVAIIDGKVWDTWDSTSGCIGNYWIKE